jgi:hypothetical protein
MWGKFARDRTRSLFNRFPGWYRAQVVDTNDPLQIHRVKFRCPELHSFDLDAELCPWSVPSPSMGGKGSGSWVSPSIGDIIWITWEKGHPYGPIFCGFADGTRLRRYPLHSVYIESPEPLDFKGDAENPTLGSAPTDELEAKSGDIDDFLPKFLPKDRRPMSHGWQTRYGNYEITKAVGFWPKEHETEPTPVGIDPVSDRDFKSDQNTIDPKEDVNSPDVKYMVRGSSYGNYIIMSDTGYYWRRHKESEQTDDNKELGEIRGDAEDKDELEDQVRKAKYLTKLFSEGVDDPSGGEGDEREPIDQRRYEMRTRMGSKLEMRDVGWAQQKGGIAAGEESSNGGIQVPKEIEDAKSRADEFTENGRILSKGGSDQRWTKLRTKGGMLIQLMDAGFHPEEDEFYKRKLIEECGPDPDGEVDDEWDKRDARQLRLVSRYGSKFVLDDRGSDSRKADGDLFESSKFANGFMIKTRRGWNYDSSGTDENPSPKFPEGVIDRGFGFEAADKPELNHMVMYTPKSKVLEFNDKLDYVMLCTDTKAEYAREWKKLKENEFVLGPVIGTLDSVKNDPEEDTYHLMMDRFNGYIRLKTAANKDKGDDGKYRRIPEGVDDKEIPDEFDFQPGLEIRDGRAEEIDGAWVELIDGDNRGIWLNEKQKLTVLRSKRGKDQCIILQDESKEVIIKNTQGKVFIDVTEGPVQVRTVNSGDITLKAAGNLFLEGKKVFMNATDGGGSQVSLDASGLGTNKDMFANVFNGDHPSTTLDSLGGPVTGRASPISGQSAGDVNPNIPERVAPDENDRAKKTQDEPEEVDEKIITGETIPGEDV